MAEAVRSTTETVSDWHGPARPASTGFGVPAVATCSASWLFSQQILHVVRCLVVERYRTIWQPLHELAHLVGVHIGQLLGRTLCNHLGIGQDIDVVRDAECFLDIV